MLHRAGQIFLTQKIRHVKPINDVAPQHLKTAHKDSIQLQLGNGVRLYYDMHDSWEIDEQGLEQCDFYFKRSFATSLPGHLGPGLHKIFPLGLNYLVYPAGIDIFAAHRARLHTRTDAQFRALFRASNPFTHIPYSPRLPVMEQPPDYGLPNKILFISQTYDPNEPVGRSENMKNDIEQLNQSRAWIIRTLRKAFGDEFIGGLIRTPYSEKHFSDVVLPIGFDSSKKHYLNLLRSFPICVTSTGLHGSIGWKMAEYVAFSKAILTEKLNYQVTGSFSEDQNYLVYDDSNSLIEGVKRLQRDRNLRQSIMQNNASYYQSHLRPDKLMLNTIQFAQNQSGLATQSIS